MTDVGDRRGLLSDFDDIRRSLPTTKQQRSRAPS
jgi:hypothetical protein